MSEDRRKSCLVAVDTDNGPRLWPVLLSDTGTVADALRSVQAGPINWEDVAVGIWGNLCPPATVPRDGDRIEVYRPLAADPRQRRRQRAALSRPAR